MFETVGRLLEHGLLDRHATVDRGGGGEPAFYKDFPPVLIASRQHSYRLFGGCGDGGDLSADQAS